MEDTYVHESLLLGAPYTYTSYVLPRLVLDVPVAVLSEIWFNRNQLRF